MIGVPDIIKNAARKLRKNMTEAEKVLWENVRRGKILGKQFQKQKPIFIYNENSGLARYIIADFYCAENKLIIEIDGGIHNIEEIYLLDKYKENLLKNKGYKVIRFENKEVFENLKNVLEKVKSLSNGLTPA